MHRDFMKDACMLELRLEYLSLVSLAHTIVRLGYLLHFSEQLVISQQHAQSLLKVSEIEVSHFELLDHHTAHYPRLRSHRFSLEVCDIGSQCTFARPGEFLTGTAADISKVAVGITREWTGAPDTQVLQD